MNSRQRRRYWIQFARQQRQIENQFTPKVQRLLEKQISSLISDAEVNGWQSAYKNLPLIQQDMIKVLESIYRKTGLTFAPQVDRGLRQKGLGFNQGVVDSVIRFLVSEGLNLVSNMDRVTKDKILEIIFQGEQEGLGFREIAKLIKESWITGYSRSLTIVRTESMRAANLTMLDAAKRNAFAVNKIWVSAKDGRTRQFEKRDEFDHWDLDGVTIDENEMFRQVGRRGTVAEAMQPGDPTAPASFTINCRCVLAFENKRDSEGRLIRKR
jgi:hypothetical protein